MNQRLIIIRGNSGAGKSTVAERLREKLDGKVAIVGLDTLRRTILLESDDMDKTDVIGLLQQTVTYCLEHGYTVIVEGILSKPKYRELLVDLTADANCDSHVFYIDVSIDETIKRHATKPIASEVSEEKLRQWYQPQNYLDVPGEVIIDETSSLDDTVKLIKQHVQL